jgi:hypothetical protein
MIGTSAISTARPTLPNITYGLVSKANITVVAANANLLRLISEQERLAITHYYVY